MKQNILLIIFNSKPADEAISALKRGKGAPTKDVVTVNPFAITFANPKSRQFDLTLSVEENCGNPKKREISCALSW